ncbi:PadR family transcriptional regulator [Nocardioides sp. zg-DK7169]|uniref:PadR family transcriptional regulator n=1 Tax=Nocardioides sp. zg-DK7169 TaxID=2736600 RepID=UPI001556546A|nr:PadR family transcriptional regulator [Nocardioides sp. zg-DK7169]NPC97177.1 PadR family transcriptional regulator [Nocardioides sp. zg-DK7169]
MALDHALLVALREQPASGADLTRRFERSLGFFWSATHQQIYRTLARMEARSWVSVTEVAQTDRPTTKVYDVSPAGCEALAAWLAEPSVTEPSRSDLAVKMRGASFGDRDAVLAVVRDALADHLARLEHYRFLEARDHPDPSALSGLELDQHLVLRGGIRLEEFWVAWLTDYLEAHR